MALRIFKSFYESLTNDKDIIGNGGYTPTDTAYGKGLYFPSGGSYPKFVTVDGVGGLNKSLDTLGANGLFIGLYTRGVCVNVAGITICPAYDSGGATTLNGKAVGAGWHWMEIRLARIPGTTVTYTRQVRLDGEEYYNDAPNLAAVWSQTPVQVFFGNGNPGYNSTLSNCYIAPPVIWDDVDDGSAMTSWMGPMLVSVLRPTGSGAKSQWLGSDGNSVDNYALVDETPVSTVDYVESSTDGERDLYVHGGMPDGYTPLGVRQVVYAQKNGANLKSMKLVFSQDNGDGTTTDTVGNEEILNDTARFISSAVLALNPKTGLPWTPTEINALQFGVESSTPVQ